MGKLKNERHEMFCVEYVVDLNGTRSAIAAGYTPGKDNANATSQASRLLTNSKVIARLEELKAERCDRLKVDADYVLHRLTEIDKMDAIDILNDDGSIKPIKDWPKIWRQFISGMDVSEMFTGSGEEKELTGLLKKIKWPDKTKNLELIGKHVDVQAFKERKEVEQKINITGLPKELAEMIGALNG